MRQNTFLAIGLVLILICSACGDKTAEEKSGTMLPPCSPMTVTSNLEGATFMAPARAILKRIVSFNEYPIKRRRSLSVLNKNEA